MSPGGSAEESCHFCGAWWLSGANPDCPFYPPVWGHLCAFVHAGLPSTLFPALPGKVKSQFFQAVFFFFFCNVNLLACRPIFLSFFPLFLFYLFIYFKFIFLFLAVLGLRFCARAFSSCGEQGPLFIAVRRPLTVAASLVVEHRLQMRRLSSCGSRA